ncbi:MAG TPA: alpha/beta fold hydrolase [Gaiellales bacterium]|nr:alpha/beta fold hydrolase [Gaiellales bacterium]
MARGLSERVFAVCTGVVAVHAVDDATLHGTGGLTGSRPAALVAVLAALALVAGYLRAGRTARTALALAVGLFATAHGIGVHVAHAAKVELSGADFTGLLELAAGIVLLLLALALQLAGRRLRARALVVLGAVLVLEWLVIPVTVGTYATSVPHAPVPAAASIGIPGAADVAFPAGDGTQLAGWWVPGTNGAAVIVMHGSSSTREATLAHVRMLARNGYGVLAFDARGHGESAGQANAFGWRGADDVVGAVAFLRRRAGVDPGRIAALGLSMGAEEALRAAALGIGLAAVVADGAGASTTGDQRLAAGGLETAIAIPQTWMTMRVTALLSGESEPEPLGTAVRRIDVPVLLIASSAGDERALDGIFRERIGPEATLWYVADAGHTRALAVHPDEYARRVTGFLSSALL